jgi:hypothetical protein
MPVLRDQDVVPVTVDVVDPQVHRSVPGRRTVAGDGQERVAPNFRAVLLDNPTGHRVRHVVLL